MIQVRLLLMRYLSEVKAKYSLKERLQTLRKHELDRSASKNLIAYDFPVGLWTKFIDALAEVLEKVGVKTEHTKTKTGHLSIGLLQDATPDEIAKIKDFGQKNPPTFKIEGVEIFAGLHSPHGYVTLKLDVPQKYREYFQFLRKLVGPRRIQDYRKFTQDLKPHVSILTFDPKDTEKVRQALPELVAAWKKLGAYSYTPKFVLVMSNFQAEDWEEITAALRTETRSA